jgi:serine/threonine-protein kinase HipA
MPLHVIGEHLDKASGHYRAETGKLVRLVRGVYVDAGDDADATLLRHAVRIAKYLYPRAYLSAASAVLLGPTSDGRLFLGGQAQAAHAHSRARDHSERSSSASFPRLRRHR